MKNTFRTAIAAILLLLISVPGEGAFKLPGPEKIVLPNGLTVYCLKSSEVPIVSFRMFIRGAGSAYEPGAIEGAANLTADLLLKGTTKMSADAVAEALDFMGADLGISATEEYAQVSAESLSEHFPKLMEIAADCLIEPALKDDEFAKERAKRIDNIKAVKDDPGSAVRFYFQKAYFGAHPMGHPALGTESALAKMTIQDIRDFYKARFRPERAVAAVVGDFDRAKLAGLLKATLGRWKAASGNAPALDIPALPRPKGPKLVLVDKPDATQAYFVIGAPGYSMGDKVTPEAAVMNTLFGGRFTSWFNTELRIKRGLTYGARSSFQVWAAGGLFSATSYTQNAKIGEMLDITYDLLKKGTEQGFSTEEVESARNYIQGQFPPTLETNAGKAAAYVRLAFFKLGFDYYGKYLAEIGAVNAAGAGKAAASFLPANDYVLVVVGKAADIKPLLAKFGTWEEKKITDPDF